MDKSKRILLNNMELRHPFPPDSVMWSIEWLEIGDINFQGLEDFHHLGHSPDLIDLSFYSLNCKKSVR